MMKYFHKGTILQLVLIIFMVLSLNIGVFFTSIIENSKAIERVKKINNERLVELSILRYYKEMIANDILISDIITVGEYIIEYTVDDLGSYYYIVTTVRNDKYEYSFNLEINIETLIISAFEYQ
ncbi:hypothetical protein [Thomasclavelia saccharogumia]|uniref:hypothetical protein n=2 Tax=Thomasclavelia saccharogumia TaxID=341225 RepID=UPI001F0AE743|nr:hypothetical protein [Thomasclavelia saccharogumia]